MSDATARTNMPLLHVGQANKEISHNEALVIMDALLQPTVEASLETEPSGLTFDDRGKCWIVGSSPTGNWADQSENIAYWTGDSWRFLTMPENTKLFSKELGVGLVRGSAGWISNNSIEVPVGGTILDLEARASIAAILSALEAQQIIPV